MSQEHHVRYYSFVDRPFGDVRSLLRERAREVFERATSSAAARARTLGASLHAQAAGLDLAVAVHIHVHRVVDEEGVAGLPPLTKLSVSWEATENAWLFPIMNAEVRIWPLTSTETQIEIAGRYRPPFGPTGAALDTVALHRIAEATVHRFLEDVVEQLRREPR
ncbi:MAG TPA: hypothetical protein VGG39_35870 [Polyangiaceae bacterium]|jgi:hypothetical protein